MLELLNKKIDMHLQEHYVGGSLKLEGADYTDLVRKVGKEYIKLKKVCRDADFYIEEAIAMAFEEMKKDEGTVLGDYDRS